jgi:putative addiction module component (TIGR02574 family)
MSESAAEQIKVDALSLPTEDRCDLARRLLDSLESDDVDRIEQVQMAIAQRRLDELTTGQVAGVPAEEVFTRLRSRNIPT